MSDKIESTAFHKLSYGLFVVTCNDGERDNGLVVNTVIQQASSPLKISVTISKSSYSHDVIKSTKKLNVNCLSTDTPFSVFENFGFKSGRDTDKMKDVFYWKSQNGLAVLSGEIINAFFSLEVTDYVDLGSHGLFICDVVEARDASDTPSMTYEYYHKNVKPKKSDTGVKGYVCKICGYVHEGDTLPEDFICPICKHGAVDFEKIQN
ncbi:MAG: flavin reductase [Clostridia bacterium]|nr:flavin reductase [Clostridia bacterium]